MDDYEVKKISMELWRWTACIKALKTEKYQPKEGGTKKNSNLKNIGPKRATKKKVKKKKNLFRPTDPCFGTHRVVQQVFILGHKALFGIINIQYKFTPGSPPGLACSQN